jgi:hypothetical protein
LRPGCREASRAGMPVPERIRKNLFDDVLNDLIFP